VELEVCFLPWLNCGILLATVQHPQSEKSELEALCQGKDKILEARAMENQQQAEIIRHQKAQLEKMEVYITVRKNE